MIFPKEISVNDLAMGLMAVCCFGEKDRVKLDANVTWLRQQTHETLWETALKIAQSYKAVIDVDHLSYDEFVDTACFVFGETKTKGWMCGLTAEGRLLMPPHYQTIDEMPEVFTVLRSRLAIVH